MGLQSVTYAPVLSKGEGENLTRLLVDTKPESERLVPKGGGATPPPEVSSYRESGGVGLVGVPPKKKYI